MAAIVCRMPVLALMAFIADGIRRTSKKKSATVVDTKFVAGVPIFNYHGELASDEQEWVFVVNQGTSEDEIQAMCKASRNSCNLVGHPSKGGVPFFEMRGTEDDVEAVIHSGKGAVKFVEPDQEVEAIPEIEAEDVEAATWGLDRIAADQRGRSGAGATIYVLDTGVRVSHEEFSGRATAAMDITAGIIEECQGDLMCAFDRNGHGTHCAGSAAGLSYGVAPGAAVKAVKVLPDEWGMLWSWLYAALDWIATNQDRPAVASLSLGTVGLVSAAKDAVDATVNAGITVVVAGGNSNSDACRFTPAFVPSAITVGASTFLNSRASFSNWGSCTNIWAPGASIRSSDHTGDSDYVVKSGTSMACPHVSGGAALLLAADPSMKASAVLETLLASAADGVLTDLKWGLDTNKLLYVGEGGAPPSPPWTTTTKLTTPTTTTTTLYPNCRNFCREEIALQQCLVLFCQGCPWCQ